MTQRDKRTGIEWRGTNDAELGTGHVLDVVLPSFSALALRLVRARVWRSLSTLLRKDRIAGPGGIWAYLDMHRVERWKA